MDFQPDFLVIGHVTLDLVNGGLVPGGTAFYASTAAARLGRRVALLTRGAPEQAQEALAGLAQVVDLPSSTTTTFENRYTDGQRTQYIRSLAPPIEARHLPQEWSRCPVVLLAPVADEVDPSLAALFSDSILGVSPQGWMRRWDASGLVGPAPWGGEEVVERAQVVVLSESDLPCRTVPAAWLRDHRGILVLTQGPRGALVHWSRKRFRIPPFPAIEADPTGAGDVFTAAYLVRYSETGDPLASGLFAGCAASLKVEAKGSVGVPTRDQIEKRISLHRELKVVPF